jgi:hypothetical protein
MTCFRLPVNAPGYGIPVHQRTQMRENSFFIWIQQYFDRVTDHVVHRDVDIVNEGVKYLPITESSNPASDIARHRFPCILKRFRQTNGHIVIGRQHAGERDIERQQLASRLITAFGAPGPRTTSCGSGLIPALRNASR